MFSSFFFFFSQFYGGCIVAQIKISVVHLSCLLILFLLNPLQGKQRGGETFPYFSLALTVFPKKPKACITVQCLLSCLILMCF